MTSKDGPKNVMESVTIACAVDDKGEPISKAIRYFCYECMGWQKSEVRNCTAPNCPLFPYRPLKIAPEVPQNATSVAQG
jgi:hypothetical protein